MSASRPDSSNLKYAVTQAIVSWSLSNLHEYHHGYTSVSDSVIVLAINDIILIN